MHHSVLWGELPPNNGMISHLLGSCSARPHHNQSCRWNQSQINTNNCSRKKTKYQHNVCGRYHPGCSIRSRNWWKYMPSWKSVNMKRFYLWHIYVKHQRFYQLTIYTCPLKCRSNIHQKYWWSSWKSISCLVQPKWDSQHTVTRIGTKTPFSDLYQSIWEWICCL